MSSIRTETSQLFINQAQETGGGSVSGVNRNNQPLTSGVNQPQPVAASEAQVSQVFNRLIAQQNEGWSHTPPTLQQPSGAAVQPAEIVPGRVALERSRVHNFSDGSTVRLGGTFEGFYLREEDTSVQRAISGGATGATSWFGARASLEGVSAGSLDVIDNPAIASQTTAGFRLSGAASNLGANNPQARVDARAVLGSSNHGVFLGAGINTDSQGSAYLGVQTELGQGRLTITGTATNGPRSGDATTTLRGEWRGRAGQNLNLGVHGQVESGSNGQRAISLGVELEEGQDRFSGSLTHRSNRGNNNDSLRAEVEWRRQLAGQSSVGVSGFVENRSGDETNLGLMFRFRRNF